MLDFLGGRLVDYSPLPFLYLFWGSLGCRVLSTLPPPPCDILERGKKTVASPALPPNENYLPTPLRTYHQEHSWDCTSLDNAGADQLPRGGIPTFCLEPST